MRVFVQWMLRVNVRRLKFFEECDVDLEGPDDGLVVSFD